jgi:hypothetical protein
MSTEKPGDFSKTLIVWWTYGLEHGAQDFRINPPEIVDAHIKRKVDRFRKVPDKDWRWWQVSKDLIIERPPAKGALFGEDSRIYYLLNRGISVIDNVYMSPPDDNWKWLIHICDFSYQHEDRYWLMKDLFCDIVVENDNQTYHLFDLPDMAQALDVGLITSAQSGGILQRIDWMVNSIWHNKFPIREIELGQAAAQRMGW